MRKDFAIYWFLVTWTDAEFSQIENSLRKPECRPTIKEFGSKWRNLIVNKLKQNEFALK